MNTEIDNPSAELCDPVENLNMCFIYVIDIVTLAAVEGTHLNSLKHCWVLVEKRPVSRSLFLQTLQNVIGDSHTGSNQVNG